MANIGTTITPWQIFFQQSAVVDKGMDVRDIRYGKIDTFVGSLVTCIVAAFIIIATAAIVLLSSGRDDPRRFGRPDCRAHGGRHDHAQSPIGPMGAGLVWHRPVRRRPAGRPVHFSLHELGRGGGVRLGPFAEQERPRGALVLRGLPGHVDHGGAGGLVSTTEVQDSITKFVQVVAVTLLPAALTFLILLLNDRELMGEYVNTLWENIANWSIVLFVIIVSTIYAVFQLFG